MATNNRTNDTTEEINQVRRQLSGLYKERKFKCDHKNGHGPTLYDPSAPEVQQFVDSKMKFNEMDMICSQCGEIINMESLTTDVIEGAFQAITDMCNQTMLLCSLNTKEFDAIVEVKRNLDITKSIVVPFYTNNVIKPLMGGKGKNKNNEKRTKGKMGIISGSFSRR